MSARVRLILAGVVCIGAVGCRHKAAPLVIPAPTPVAVTNPPANPAQLPTESAGKVPLASVPAVPGEPAKVVRKKAAPAPPVEVAVATPPPPPPMELGSLTTAGSDSEKNRKEAADLLAANDKRLAGLSADFKAREKDQVVRVQSFQTDGMKALNSGDSEAAITLATKAKVLLDEITK
jgi:hypothetical protein